MVVATIQLLLAIGVALSVVQAGPIDNSNGGNKPGLNNKVHFSFSLSSYSYVFHHVRTPKLILHVRNAQR